eukprot:UC4_evm14s179
MSDTSPHSEIISKDEPIHWMQTSRHHSYSEREKIDELICLRDRLISAGVPENLPRGWRKLIKRVRSNSPDGLIAADCEYFADTNTCTTTWLDPRLSQVLDGLHVHDYIRYASYRVASKIRDLQLYTGTNSITLRTFQNAMHAMNLEDDRSRLLSRNDVHLALLEVFANTANPFQRASFLTCLVFYVHDEVPRGFVRASDFQLVVSLLVSPAYLEEQYRYSFSLFADEDLNENFESVMSHEALASYIKSTQRLLAVVGEAEHFGCQAESISKSVSDALAQYALLGISDRGLYEEEFVKWQLSEPLATIWLPTLQVKEYRAADISGRNRRVDRVIGLKRSIVSSMKTAGDFVKLGRKSNKIKQNQASRYHVVGSSSGFNHFTVNSILSPVEVIDSKENKLNIPSTQISGAHNQQTQIDHHSSHAILSDGYPFTSATGDGNKSCGKVKDRTFPLKFDSSGLDQSNKDLLAKLEEEKEKLEAELEFANLQVDKQKAQSKKALELDREECHRIKTSLENERKIQEGLKEEVQSISLMLSSQNHYKENVGHTTAAGKVVDDTMREENIAMKSTDVPSILESPPQELISKTWPPTLDPIKLSVAEAIISRERTMDSSIIKNSFQNVIGASVELADTIGAVIRNINKRMMRRGSLEAHTTENNTEKRIKLLKAMSFDELLSSEFSQTESDSECGIGKAPYKLENLDDKITRLQATVESLDCTDVIRLSGRRRSSLEAIDLEDEK